MTAHDDLRYIATGFWEGTEMAGAKETVNLDALIERADFELEEKGAAAGRMGSELTLTTLTPEDRLAVLRKPDFQRETSGWSPNIVADFIESVANADVVPALIIWRSPTSGKQFVIDGAHRLSAIAAWVNNDYGDGGISEAFYGKENISEHQRQVAKKTRDLVEDQVGRYHDLIEYARKLRAAPTQRVERFASNIHAVPLYVQQIPGDAGAAEKSYKRINSTAVAINRQELFLIDSRHYPAGIATRAILRAGTGYEYWWRFPDPTKSDIKSTAALIYEQLIKPITEYPLKALDLPSPKGGYGANSLRTILDLVTILNPQKRNMEKDLDGTETLKLLEHVRRSTERVFGKSHSGSLALHPALYCYDISGKFVGKAFIGAIEFVRELERRNLFYAFTEVRGRFEDFLIRYPHLMTQIGKTQGSGGRRGVPAVVALYNTLFDGLRQGKSEAEIIATIKESKALSFLDWNEPIENDAGKRFTDADKATALIKTALAREICDECGGRMYIKDRSFDHRERLADGGRSVASNAALTHPYCNSGYKE
ncbi:MAG: DUF262 domain-containing protein, partial [Xanthobacteraceae bacterium]